MAPTRLATLALAGSLLYLSGCGSLDFLHPGRTRSCAPGCECEDVAALPGSCVGGACSTGIYPEAPLITNSHPSGIEGPALFPPAPLPVPTPVPTPVPAPGLVMPPAATGPRPAPLPSVVTIPQAIASPSPP
jgi:hypothetical protein